MIRAVVFDFGQTLVDSAGGFRAAEKQLQARILAALPNVASEEFVEYYRQQRTEFQRGSDFSRKSLSLAVCEHFGRSADPQDASRWEDEYWETVRANTKEFPEARQVLQTLKKSFCLGLITNTQGQGQPGTHRLCDFHELMDCFDAVVVAGEDGIPEKPDPQPFQMCLDLLGCSASEAVYVGDDWRIDLCGARSAGMHAVWLQHRSTRRTWPSVADDFPIIGSLDELLQLPLILESEPV
jgi:HAD superfamily hydrolase (TIGR01549 family)